MGALPSLCAVIAFPSEARRQLNPVNKLTIKQYSTFTYMRHIGIECRFDFYLLFHGTYNETWCTMLYTRPCAPSSIWVINLFSRCFLRLNIDARDTLRDYIANVNSRMLSITHYNTSYLLRILYER